MSSMRLIWLAATTLMLAACATAPVKGASLPLDASSKAAEFEFAKQTLQGLQKRSIDQNREYCGYLGLETDGSLWASQATPGEEGSCWSKRPPKRIKVTASYHTHAAYSAAYDS